MDRFKCYGSVLQITEKNTVQLVKDDTSTMY